MEPIEEEGFVFFEICGRKTAFLCPSHARVRMLSENPLLPLLNVFVHEDEWRVYRQALGGRLATLRTHRIVGNLAAISNQMLVEAWDAGAEAVIRLDDDFRGFRSRASLLGRASYQTLEAIVSVLASALLVAAEAGAGVSGFVHRPTPSTHSALAPLSLRDWVPGGATIILDPRVRSDAEIVLQEDVTRSLHSLALTQLCIAQPRFNIVTAGKGEPGGEAGFRTDTLRRQAVRQLAAQWPEAVKASSDELYVIVKVPN